MNFFVKLIIALPVITICLLLMKYSVWFTDQTGKIGFAEKYLQTPFAGTYTFYRLIALGIIALMFLWLGGFVELIPQ